LTTHRTQTVNRLYELILRFTYQFTANQLRFAKITTTKIKQNATKHAANDTSTTVQYTQENHIYRHIHK